VLLQLPLYLVVFVEAAAKQCKRTHHKKSIALNAILCWWKQRIAVCREAINALDCETKGLWSTEMAFDALEGETKGLWSKEKRQEGGLTR
jgi:hypothetical protein